MNGVRLEYAREGVYRVLSGTTHVGNLKRIGAVWKFKAIGYQCDGAVVPGGGRYTDRHNAAIDGPDPIALTRALRGD
jgi:hypothetical protein